MDARANSWLADEIAGVLDWWHEAGIDYAFRDDPRDWLAVPVRAETPATPAFVPPPQREEAPAFPPSEPAEWPRDLAAFSDWWLAEPWLDAGRTQGRVAPRGIAGARLMVLVPQPEPEDEDTLLSGMQGKLVTAMLEAMGIAPAEAYVAAALPRHTPSADWNEIRLRGLDKVLLRHVELVAPERVIAFGDTIPSLLGHDPTLSAAPLTDIAVGTRPIPLLVLRSLEGLLARPGWKAEAWRKWLAWTR